MHPLAEELPDDELLLDDVPLIAPELVVEDELFVELALELPALEPLALEPPVLAVELLPPPLLEELAFVLPPPDELVKLVDVAELAELAEPEPLALVDDAELGPADDAAPPGPPPATSGRSSCSEASGSTPSGVRRATPSYASFRPSPSPTW